MYMCLGLAPERGRGFEEYGGSSGPSLKSGKDVWNGGLPPCQVLNEVGERETTKTKPGKNVQAGAVPKYTLASVEGEKGTKTRSRGRLPPPHSDFRRGFIPRGAEKWSLWPLNVVTTPLKSWH